MNIIIGFLTGVAASMGLGGGFILIIYMTVFTDISQKASGGINLLFFLPIALISIIIHTKNKLIEWKLVPLACIVGAGGVALGYLLLSVLDEDILRKIFAVLLILVGIKEIFHKNSKKT